VAVALLALAVAALAGTFSYQGYRDAHRKIPVVAVDSLTGIGQRFDLASYEYIPKERETKNYLGNYVTWRYGRRKFTVIQDWHNSLNFLDQITAAKLMAEEDSSHEIQDFAGRSNADVLIEIRGTLLQQMTKSPYAAIVEFDKVFLNQSGTPERQETWYDTITFTADPSRVPDDTPLSRINPLGFVVFEQLNKTLVPNDKEKSN
jgi:hypothetical protein